MNFDELGRKLKQFGQNTAVEVQKLNEVRQLNSGIGSEKKRIRSTYAEIGRKLYNMYKDEPLAGFESEIQSLKISFRKIDRLQDQIRTVKGVRLCPHCKAEIDAAERFCPNCGAKMPEEYTVDETEIFAHQEDETLEYQTRSKEDAVNAEKESADTEEAADGAESAFVAGGEAESASAAGGEAGAASVTGGKTEESAEMPVCGAAADTKVPGQENDGAEVSEQMEAEAAEEPAGTVNEEPEAAAEEIAETVNEAPAAIAEESFGDDE